MKYLGWRSSVENETCVLETLQNVSDLFELSRGVSRATNFPEDALLHMDANFPKAVKLADQLDSDSGLTIVNAKIAAAITQLSLPDVELLPVSILNHKGDDINQKYFVVNPYTVIDCIDKEASTLMWNPLDKDLIAGVLELKLLDDFKTESIIFRPKHYPQRILVREDFAKKIEALNPSGIRFVEIDELI